VDETRRKLAEKLYVTQTVVPVGAGLRLAVLDSA
jgi:hypothetical protein